MAGSVNAARSRPGSVYHLPSDTPAMVHWGREDNRSKLADGLSNPHVGFIHSMVSLWYWVKWKCKRRKYRQRCWEFEGECPLAPGKVKRQLGEGGDIRLRARNS